MADFRLPDLGEGLEEAEIVRWHVQVGDRVAVDQVVVEVETAKAAVEVPVPFAGIVAALHATPGATVKVGAPLISVETAPSADSTSPPPSGGPGFREPGVAMPDPQPAAEDEASGNVLIGYGTGSATRARRRRPRRPLGQPTPSGATPSAESARAVAVLPPVINPLVRRQALEAGIDLRTVRGSGPAGMIRRTDVEAATRSSAAPSRTDTDLDATRIPLRGVRRTVADKLSRSRREIPEATVWVDVDATDLVSARAALNARTPEQPVSLLALVARFTVLALRRYPELNAHLDGDEIVIPSHVHLGFAAQTERGLVVPVIRDAHRLSTRDLSAALAAGTAAARSGRLSPAELVGGTITVNNYGVFGVDGSAAIINHPEVAIIGLGRIIDRPWVIDGALTVRKISQLTLTFDHRVCDGGTAGGFLRYLGDCIEKPITALGDL